MISTKTIPIRMMPNKIKVIEMFLNTFSMKKFETLETSISLFKYSLFF